MLALVNNDLWHSPRFGPLIDSLIVNLNSLRGVWQAAVTYRESVELRAFLLSKPDSSVDADISLFALQQIDAYSASALVREEIRLVLQGIFQSEWPDVEVLAFGSSMNGFGGTASDIDFILRIEPALIQPSQEDFLMLLAALCSSTAAFEVEEVVDSARVPVIKLRHKESNIACDLCINNELPLKNTQLLLAYSRYEQLRQLGYAIKYWAKRRGLNSPQNATLTSYAWVILLIFHFQQLEAVPNLQKNKQDLSASIESLSLADGDSKRCATDASLHELLYRFFSYYSGEGDENFDCHKYAASIRLGCRVERQSKSHNGLSEVADRGDGFRFCIEDPFEDHDLGRVIREPWGQQHILAELQRGKSILKAGGSSCWSLLTAENFEAPEIPYTCRACGELGHLFKECPLNENRCFSCNQPGHTRKECTACAVCKQTGHLKSTCPVALKRKANRESKQPADRRAPAEGKGPKSAERTNHGGGAQVKKDVRAGQKGGQVSESVVAGRGEKVEQAPKKQGTKVKNVPVKESPRVQGQERVMPIQKQSISSDRVEVDHKSSIAAEAHADNSAELDVGARAGAAKKTSRQNRRQQRNQEKELKVKHEQSGA